MALIYSKIHSQSFMRPHQKKDPVIPIQKNKVATFDKVLTKSYSKLI